MTEQNADLVRFRGTLARLMVEDSLEWRQILEGDLAKMLGVAPGPEPFTWRWFDHIEEGINLDDECPSCLALPNYWVGGLCVVCAEQSDGRGVT